LERQENHDYRRNKHATPDDIDFPNLFTHSQLALRFPLWWLKSRINEATVIAPTGVFVLKHHRQLALVVSTPPIRGPATVATPNSEPRMPLYSARFERGITTAIIDKQPE
jgi:hypothetical protein